MEAKNKAKELVERFIEYANGSEYGLWDRDTELKSAKQCALIAVDEIINELEDNLYDSFYYGDRQEYWQEVQQEIERL